MLALTTVHGVLRVHVRDTGFRDAAQAVTPLPEREPRRRAGARRILA